MRRVAMSFLLYLLVMAGLPSAANAVVANIKVQDANGSTIQTFTFPPSGTLPLNLTRNANSLSGSRGYGDGAGCATNGSSSSGRCFTITGEAAFISDATNPGQLKLRGPGGSGKFVVKNTGSVYARILIETFQTNAATDPARTTICAGHSGDGWFSGTASTSNNPRSFFEQTMRVVFTTNSGGTITNLVNGSNPSNCDDPLVSGTTSLKYTLGNSGQTSTSYNPQNPKQIFQRIPTCTNCAPGAQLQKFLTLGLPAGGINNHVGTHFSSICEVPERKPNAADFAECNQLLGSLFIPKEATATVNNSVVKAGDQGTILVDLNGAEHFDVEDILVVPPTPAGEPVCTLFAGDSTVGGDAVHSTFGFFNNDSILDLRMHFDNADVLPEIGDEELILKCQANILGVQREVTVGIPVTVTH